MAKPHASRSFYVINIAGQVYRFNTIRPTNSLIVI